MKWINKIIDVLFSYRNRILLIVLFLIFMIFLRLFFSLLYPFSHSLSLLNFFLALPSLHKMYIDVYIVKKNFFSFILKHYNDGKRYFFQSNMFLYPLVQRDKWSYLFLNNIFVIFFKLTILNSWSYNISGK